MGITEFITESNAIEGIYGEPTPAEIEAHQDFLELPEIRVGDLEEFVRVIVGKSLRLLPGQDVRVGSHFPPPGGPEIANWLKRILADANTSERTPYEIHVAYETLHPFMDGNGRSGRVLWAWQMLKEGYDPYSLPFLHRFYYQALDGKRNT